MNLIFAVSKLGYRIPANNYALDISGYQRISSPYAALVINDTNQNPSGGGLFRILGEAAAYGGGYNLQFNTGVTQDFTEGLPFLRFLQAGKSLSPGTDNDISLGAGTLRWASIQGNNFICYSGNVSALNGTLVQSWSGDNYLYNQTIKNDGNVGYSFYRTGILEWLIRDRGDRDFEVLDNRLNQRLFIPQIGAGDYVNIPSLVLDSYTNTGRKAFVSPVDSQIIYQSDSGVGFRGRINGDWYKFAMLPDNSTAALAVLGVRKRVIFPKYESKFSWVSNTLTSLATTARNSSESANFSSSAAIRMLKLASACF
ncbi:hypothetical protein CCP3SC5AM1_3300001 [Gammaproteobacteria bacterium]